MQYVELKRALTRLKTLDISVEDFLREFPDIVSIERWPGHFGVRYFPRPTGDVLPDVEITKDNVTVALDKHLSGEVSERDLVLWANFVKHADDIFAFEDKPGSPVSSVLYWIAIPEINGGLTPERLQEYRALMS